MNPEEYIMVDPGGGSLEGVAPKGLLAGGSKGVEVQFGQSEADQIL
jgi:hypothetical protein